MWNQNCGGRCEYVLLKLCICCVMFCEVMSAMNRIAASWIVVVRLGVIVKVKDVGLMAGSVVMSCERFLMCGVLCTVDRPKVLEVFHNFGNLPGVMCVVMVLLIWVDNRLDSLQNV